MVISSSATATTLLVHWLEYPREHREGGRRAEPVALHQHDLRLTDHGAGIDRTPWVPHGAENARAAPRHAPQAIPLRPRPQQLKLPTGLATAAPGQ